MEQEEQCYVCEQWQGGKSRCFPSAARLGTEDAAFGSSQPRIFNTSADRRSEDELSVWRIQ